MANLLKTVNDCTTGEEYSISTSLNSEGKLTQESILEFINDDQIEDECKSLLNIYHDCEEPPATEQLDWQEFLNIIHELVNTGKARFEMLNLDLDSPDANDILLLPAYSPEFANTKV